MSGPILSVRELRKRWDASSGLPAVSLDLATGEILVVRGRSGTGKTTLLSILAGWCEPDGGTVERLGGWGLGGTWRRWEHTAVVPQVLALLPELSALENVALGAQARAGSHREARQRASDVMEQLDVAALARRSPAEASIGQQQRIALARAVVATPTVMLVDEPTSHQDDAHAGMVIDAIHRCALGGSAAIVVTHDPRLDGRADRVLTLSALEDG